MKIAAISARYFSRVLSLISIPSNMISPDSGTYRLASNFRKVDLPEPLPPVMNTRSPNRRLSQIYDVLFSENRGKALISSLLGAMIPTSSGLGAADALKAVPVMGMVISAFVTPVLAAGATYAIGKVFIQHFASGGTLLDFNPPDYREFLKGQKEMWVKRSRYAFRLFCAR